ncbi:unnamed protein product [Effrenium voratum]|nr:unnamed protein product [Effrenium voratum]
MTGRISSALNLLHELQREADGSEGSIFEDFRVTAGRLAYQLVCNQQLDFLFVAMHMLRNVGESVNRFFKAVAFHTSKRLVRRRLLRHVQHMRRLTREEQSLICLVNLLERLYTNPCYTTEFNRMTTGLTTGQYPQRAHSESVPPFCTWPAGGQPMLLVGLVCDGAIGGHIAAGRRAAEQSTGEAGRDVTVHWVNQRGPQFFEQQTSLRESCRWLNACRWSSMTCGAATRRRPWRRCWRCQQKLGAPGRPCPAATWKTWMQPPCLAFRTSTKAPTSHRTSMARTRLRTCGSRRMARATARNAEQLGIRATGESKLPTLPSRGAAR